MKRRRTRNPISWHPDPKVRGMQEELQNWMAQNDFAEDVRWQTGEDYYGKELLTHDEPTCLVLEYDGEICEVLYCTLTDHPSYPHWVKLRDEFDRIVKHHGFWFDYKDHVTIEFMVGENE